MTSHPMRFIGPAVGFSLALGLVGCDYWPPALQAEIEQLRTETQTLAMEKNQIQAQVTELSTAKLELQGKVDELSRMNREKTVMITGLQNQLDTMRAKALRAMAPKASPHKAPANMLSKPGAKTRPKNNPKAPAATTPTQKSVGLR